MPRIIKNAIRCKKCGDIIESKTVHDFKFCSCGSCAVDGGHAYLRRCGHRGDWDELSDLEWEEPEDISSEEYNEWDEKRQELEEEIEELEEKRGE